LTVKLELLHRGLLAEYVSLAWMTIESIAAISAGVFSGSLALIAFGGDSFVELLSSYTVADFLKNMEKSGKAARERGERVEKIATLLLVTLIPAIGLGGAYSYFSGIEAEASPVGILVAIGAVVIMPFLWYEKRRIGQATSCLPLAIDAVESAACFLMSIALLLSLLANYLWKISWTDYLATLIILAFVAKEAIDAVSETQRSKGADSILKAASSS
jgi:divalent metal cation (Fe/Co/Zn/Cd) transporter